jgi:hypothetical protein
LLRRQVEALTSASLFTQRGLPLGDGVQLNAVR